MFGELSKWIWLHNEDSLDEYGDFFGSFSALKAPVTIKISCDGDYALFLNGKFVASNQYGDFEHYKIYDELDVSKFVKDGENKLYILIWHIGVNSSRYKSAKPGVIFEVWQGEKPLLLSSDSILCRKNAAYKNGRCKKITNQLGLGFAYDSTKENMGELAPATEVLKNCTFYKRPIPKLKLSRKKEAKILKQKGNYYLVDLGEESVGLPTFEFKSDRKQKIRVCWGEDLQKGHVRRIIGDRDFCFEYIAKKGVNKFTNYMLRLGCRYLELYSRHPINLKYLTIIPQSYPVKEKPCNIKNELDKRIYDVCVRTLKLSMMEHYVDTPWREQCLYVFDARNQMKFGYECFKDGNALYARSNLKLMSEDRREDGLLSICYPSGGVLAIPSFSLYWFLAVREYLDFTGDVSFAEEIYNKLCSVLDVFLNNVHNGLLGTFDGGKRWNFYDWTEFMNGGRNQGKEYPDLMINCLFLMALKNFKVICGYLNRDFLHDELIETIRLNTRREFYDREEKAFSLTRGGKEFTVLGNALAVLTDVAEDKNAICEKISSGKMVDCSLSMKCFKYDALLLTNKRKWKQRVLDEIRSEYKAMLDAGATSVWETKDGAKAFSNAGSLCHGWSAVPVYYLRKLR